MSVPERQTAEFVRKPWRCGGQVGRTLYVDHGDGEKDPALLFGLVDTLELAEHIVDLHNWWLAQKEEAEAMWGAQDDGSACGTPTSDTGQRDRTDL